MDRRPHVDAGSKQAKGPCKYDSQVNTTIPSWLASLTPLYSTKFLTLRSRSLPCVIFFLSFPFFHMHVRHKTSYTLLVKFIVILSKLTDTCGKIGRKNHAIPPAEPQKSGNNVRTVHTNLPPEKKKFGHFERTLHRFSPDPLQLGLIWCRVAFLQSLYFFFYQAILPCPLVV